MQSDRSPNFGATATQVPPAHTASQTGRSGGQGDGLSLQTLVIAAVSSAVAATVVSHFWAGGTIIAAAMTPVIVSIVKEALRRPMQSDLVRRSASRVGDVATVRRPPRADAPLQRQTAPPAPHGDVLLTGERRVYGSSGGAGGSRLARLRGKPLKVAVVTGLLAFAVAAVVLTVPELVFGGAATSHHRTTLFGGGSGKKDERKADQPNRQDGSQSPSQGGAAPAQPQDGGSQTPTAPPTQTAPAPQQQPPSGGSAPAPSDSGGAAPQQPAPSSPTSP